MSQIDAYEEARAIALAASQEEFNLPAYTGGFSDLEYLRQYVLTQVTQIYGVQEGVFDQATLVSTSILRDFVHRALWQFNDGRQAFATLNISEMLDVAPGLRYPAYGACNLSSWQEYQVFRAFGFSTECIGGFDTLDGSSNASHQTTVVWLEDLNKWIIQDATFNVLVRDAATDEPLSWSEARQLLSEGGSTKFDSFNIYTYYQEQGVLDSPPAGLAQSLEYATFDVPVMLYDSEGRALHAPSIWFPRFGVAHDPNSDQGNVFGDAAEAITHLQGLLAAGLDWLQAAFTLRDSGYYVTGFETFDDPGHWLTVRLADGTYLSYKLEDGQNLVGSLDQLWDQRLIPINVHQLAWSGEVATGFAPEQAAEHLRWAADLPDDFNRDGFSDILLRHTDATVSLLGSSGDPASVAISEQLNSGWRAVGIADFQGDGKADILWRHANGALKLFRMDGADVLAVANFPAYHDNDWDIAGIGDFEGDGGADLVWRQASGLTQIWMMNGSDLVYAGAPSIELGVDWRIKGVADFNGDGIDEILWRHKHGGTKLMQIDGGLGWGSKHVVVADIAIDRDSAWNIQGVADFDGDGRADILWRKVDGTTNISLMNGPTAVADGDLSQQLDRSWQVSDVGDYDADGSADILWRQADGTFKTLLLDGNTVLAVSDAQLASSEWVIIGSGIAPNDVPALTSSLGGAAASEQVPATIDVALELADLDNATLASATVSIIGNFQFAEDLLEFINDGTMGNIVGAYSAATGTLTLTSAEATATLDEWQAALRSVTYVNTSDRPTTASRIIGFVVNDGASSSSTATKIINVAAVNDAPMASIIADQNSPEDAAWSYQIPAHVFADVDGDSLTYGAVLVGEGALPSWLSFNPVTRSFAGTPPANYNGTIDLTVTASDGSLIASATFRLTITPVNDAPVVASPLMDQSSPADIPWSHQISADAFVDPDGDALTYGATLASGDALPSWLSFDAVTRSFAGTAPPNYNGAIDLTVTASDGSLTASETFRLTVKRVNDAPMVASPLMDQSSPEDTPWSHQISADAFVDPDGDALTYDAALASGAALPSWLSFDPVTRTFAGTPPPHYNGALDLTVTASDGSLIASETFRLTITPVNDAPMIASPLRDQSSPEDTPWSHQVPGGAFVDPDGDALTYSAALASDGALPSWLRFDPVTRTFAGTPPANYSGAIDLIVTASDGLSSTADTFQLTITPVPETPARNDFGADGRSDILWSHDSGQLAIWAMNGGQQAGYRFLGFVGSDWQLARTGDFNGDGHVDILWRHTGGAVALWDVVDGQQAGYYFVGDVANDWQILDVADFNHDGTSDILWSHESGQLAIWDMNGGQQSGYHFLGFVDSDWRVDQIGDFNGDFHTDILWRHTGGSVAVWDIVNGEQAGYHFVGAIGNDWQIADSGDFNGDGTDDLLWIHESGELAVWNMNDRQQSGYQFLGSVGSEWQVAKTGDFNGDGHADILWRHTSGALALWEMMNSQQASYQFLGHVDNEWHIA